MHIIRMDGDERVRARQAGRRKGEGISQDFHVRYIEGPLARMALESFPFRLFFLILEGVEICFVVSGI